MLSIFKHLKPHSSSRPPIQQPAPKPWSRLKINDCNKKVLVASLAVVAPMVAFTIALLWIVFSRRVHLDHCPYPELCYSPNPQDAIKASHYYVDFPLGSLVFVSSLSSIVCIALVAAVMTIYGSVAAHQLLELGGSSPNQPGNFMSPYEISLLIRMLNAELFILFSMKSRLLPRWKHKRSASAPTKKSRSTNVVRRCLLMFILALTSSILIQAADTYLKITTTVISATKLVSMEHALPECSRVLAPWCFSSDSTVGTMANKYFWGCGVSLSQLQFGHNEPSTLMKPNKPQLWNNAQSELDSYTSSYEDKAGLSYTIVHPSNIDENLDWMGSTYGVSTSCTAISKSRCEYGEVYLSPYAESFRCNQTSGGKTDADRNISGNFSGVITTKWYSDWHKHLMESGPFHAQSEVSASSKEIIANSTFELADSYFRNPWHWLVSLTLLVEMEKLPNAFLENDILWRHNTTQLLPQLLLSCETTVWDINASFTNSRVAVISVSKSNGTIAGIVSMSTVSAWGFNGNNEHRALDVANRNLTSPQAVIKSFEGAVNQGLAVGLIANTVAAPIARAQRRVTKVLTDLPAISLWLLVAANLIFALLGLVLAVFAIRCASSEVYQVQTRLATAGLAAQLFEWKHARKEAKDDKELFEENFPETDRKEPGVGVSIKSNALGGAEFVAKNAFLHSIGKEEGKTELKSRQTF